MPLKALNLVFRGIVPSIYDTFGVVLTCLVCIGIFTEMLFSIYKAHLLDLTYLILIGICYSQ